MKNIKFKVVSIFCAFSLLGVLTTSVNAMEKEDSGNKENFSNINSNFNENCINQLQDGFETEAFNFKEGVFFNENNNADNKSNDDKDKDKLEDNKLFDYLGITKKYISDENCDGEMNENEDSEEDDKEFNYLNFETKGSLNKTYNYEIDKNSVFENNGAKVVDANNKKNDIDKLLNLKDEKLKNITSFIQKENRINLNNNFKNLNNFNNYNLNNYNFNNYNLNNYNFNNYNLYNNQNFINLNNNMKRDDAVDLIFEDYKLKFSYILERINYRIQDKLRYGARQLISYYDNYSSEYNILFSNYNKFLESNKEKIFKNCHYKDEINILTKTILENLEVIHDEYMLQKDVEKTLDFYKGKFKRILKKIKKMISSKSFETDNISEIKKYSDYCNSYCNYINSINFKFNKINNIVKFKIFRLIKKSKKKIDELNVLINLIAHREKFDKVLKKLVQIITEKKYEEKDDIIKCYDSLRRDYKKFSNINKQIIDRNDEVFKINEETSRVKDLIGIIKDLLWNRAKFDKFLKYFELLKGNFNQKSFNTKKDDFEQKVFEYKESIESNKKIIDKVDYLGILKQEIFDIINDVDKKILEIGEKYNSKQSI